MPIENIKGILLANTNLSEEVRNDILELIQVFIKSFPEVSLDRLCANLKELKIDKVSKYVTDDYAYYNGKNNTLYINKSKITDNDDVKHIMMHQLLNIITYNGSFSGFNQNNFFRALNVGFTEILTNNLVGNEGENSYYDDEVVITNLLASIVGVDVLTECYFSNNARTVLESLINAGGEMK